MDSETASWGILNCRTNQCNLHINYQFLLQFLQWLSLRQLWDIWLSVKVNNYIFLMTIWLHVEPSLHWNFLQASRRWQQLQKKIPFDTSLPLKQDRQVLFISNTWFVIFCHYFIWLNINQIYIYISTLKWGTLIPPRYILWEVEWNCSTRRNPTHPQEEHANSTYTSPKVRI